jgi:hypothetical protein
MNDQKAAQAWRNQGRMRRTPRLGELLPGVLKSAGATDGSRVDILRPLWNELIPADLRSRAELVALTKGCLNIEVCDPATRFEVERSLGPVLIRTIHRRFPELRVRTLRAFLRSGRCYGAVTEVKE